MDAMMKDSNMTLIWNYYLTKP